MATTTDQTTAPAPAPQPAKGGRNLLMGLALTALSIVLTVPAMQEYGGLWPLAFVALVPAIVAQYHFMPRRLSGLPIALVWFGYWTAWALMSAQIAPMPMPLIVSSLFFLAGLLVSSFDRTFNERTGFRWFLLTLPVTWVAFDMLYWQNLILGGEGHYAALVTPFPLILAPLSLFGEAALTFLLVMINSAVALVIIRSLARRSSPALVPGGAVRRTVVIATAVTVVWFLLAAWIFTGTKAEQGPPVAMAAIQIGPGDGYTAAGGGSPTPALYRKLTDMTREAARQGATMAVWGEVVLPFDPRTDRRQFVQNLARETGMYIQTGWTVGAPDPTASNLTGLWGPDGNLIGIYYKIHPVILDGEDFDQPQRYPVFDTDFGTIGMIICFDFSFEDPTRNMVNNGAQMMVASVGDWTNFAATRIQTVQIRAAENRVSFVKGENFNGSAMVDATGTVLATADMGPDGGQKVLVTDVPLGPRGAWYTTTGPLFGYLCVLLLVIRIVGQARLRLRDGRWDPAHPQAAADG